MPATAIPHITPKPTRKTLTATDAQIDALRDLGLRRFNAKMTGSGRLIISTRLYGLQAIERDGSVTSEDDAWDWGWKGA